MKHLLRANVTWSSQELIKHCKRAKLPWHKNIFYCCFLFFVLWAFIFFLSLENNVRAWIQGWFQILFFLRNSFKLWSHEMWIKVYPIQFWGVKHASNSGFNHFALEHLPFVQCWVLNGIQKSYWKNPAAQNYNENVANQTNEYCAKLCRENLEPVAKISVTETVVRPRARAAQNKVTLFFSISICYKPHLNFWWSRCELFSNTYPIQSLFKVCQLVTKQNVSSWARCPSSLKIQRKSFSCWWLVQVWFHHLCWHFPSVGMNFHHPSHWEEHTDNIWSF